MQLSVIAKTGSLVATCAHEQILCASWQAKDVYLFVTDKQVDPKPVAVQMHYRCIADA